MMTKELQDTYNTPSLGLDTTCGTLALKGAVAREDAAIVKRAIEVGLIILGKTNPTVGPLINPLALILKAPLTNRVTGIRQLQRHS
jgi:hypothetical protein